MLHKVLLRLSCFIGLFCLVIGSSVHIFKKDIVLLALHRLLPNARITCEVITGFFPLSTTLHHLSITSKDVGVIKADAVAITIDPFHMIGIAPSTGFAGEYIFQFDLLSIKGLSINPSNSSPNPALKDPPIQIRRPKIAIKIIDISGTYHFEGGDPIHFEGKGCYQYDRGTLAYTIQTPTFTHEGHALLFKNSSVTIQGNSFGMPLFIGAYIRNIANIPLDICLGGHCIHGHLVDKNGIYNFLGTYGKTKDTAIHIMWDKKDQLRLEEFSAHIGNHTLKLIDPASFNIHTKKVTKDIILTFDDQKIVLSNVGFNKQLSGQIKASKLAADIFKKDIPALDVDGNLSLDAILQGTMDNPQIDITLSTQGLKHRTVSALKIIKAHMKALYKDHTLTVNGLIDGKHDLTLKITGTATQQNLSLKTDVKGTLRHIKKILPTEDHIDGVFKGSFTTTGDLFSPKTSGELTFIKGLYENFIIGTHIKNLNGKALLKDNDIQIHLQGSDDFKGTLKGQGTVKIPAFSGDIHLDLHQFYLGQSDLFTGKTDGTITINLDKKSITGELHLDPVVVDIDQLTPSATPKIHFIEKTMTTDNSHDHAPIAVESPFVFNINLIPKNKVVVRGFGIESTWKGSLAIQGNHPDFVGKFLLDKGTIDITGRILNFTKGVITFDHKINEPYLDLEITKKIDSYDVYVQLQGRPLDSKFTFLSSPSLTQEEVLALILLGRKSAATSLGQLFDISASLSSLSSAGQDKSFFTTFRKVFGIEALEIKKQDQTSASEAPQAISIRKQISTDFSIVIEQTLNATEDENKRSKAIIEKQINDNWNVECDVSTDKSGSIGLNWVKRY